MADDGNGYGRQRPETANSEFNAVAFLVERMIGDISTVKIVKVQAVDTDAKTVQVIPLVQQMDGQGQVTDQGTIYGVPYQQWQYGKNAVLADPAVDDIGLLLCADRDISAVKEAKAAAPPGSWRTHDQADGIYLGGLLNGDAEQYIKFTDTGLELHDKNSNSLVSSSTGWLFTGKVTFQETVVMQADLGLNGVITDDTGGGYTGNIITSGHVISQGIRLSTHQHTAQGAFAVTTIPNP